MTIKITFHRNDILFLLMFHVEHQSYSGIYKPMFHVEHCKIIHCLPMFHVEPLVKMQEQKAPKLLLKPQKGKSVSGMMKTHRWQRLENS